MTKFNKDKPLTVVIVEDHEFTRMGLKLGLDQSGDIKVIGEAADGLEGVQRAIELQPNVVLMDIQLPKQDGIESTCQIRAALPNVRVVMLTSHSNDQAIFDALKAGANGYCLKTIGAQELANVIRTVAEGAIWLDPGIANTLLRAYAGSGSALTGNLAEALHQNAAGLDSPSRAPAVAGAPSVPPNQHSGSGRKVTGEAPILSPRETEVLRLVAEGNSNQLIADKLGIGLETVKTHMRHIMEKMTVSDRTQAAVKAMKQGLV
jgi:two-component system response regulator DegU